MQVWFEMLKMKGNLIFDYEFDRNKIFHVDYNFESELRYNKN